MASPKMLVTGANGELGRRVVHHLANAGQDVIAGSRVTHAPAASGPERRTVDFNQPATLATAFAGIERALIVSTDQLSPPGRRQTQHAAALQAARHAGVGFVAYTSMPNPATSPAIFFAGDHAAMEADLASGGPRHAILRNAWYQENLLAYLPQIIADGTWFTAAGEGRIAHVGRDDAAAAAAAILIAAQPGIVDIAGPELLTVDAMARIISGQLGRPLRVEHAEAGRVAAELSRQGVPDFVVHLVLATEANQRAGQFEVTSPAMADILGHTPRHFAAFVTDNAAVLRGFSRT